jgi:hypothetical protein
VLPLEVARQQLGVGADFGEKLDGFFLAAAGQEDASEADLGLDHHPALQDLAQHGFGLGLASGFVQAASQVERAHSQPRVGLGLAEHFEERHGFGPAALHLQGLGEREVDVLHRAAVLLGLAQELLGLLGLAEHQQLFARLGQNSRPAPVRELHLEQPQPAPGLEPPGRDRRHHRSVLRAQQGAADDDEVGDGAHDREPQDDHVPVPVGPDPEGVEQSGPREDHRQEAESQTQQRQDGAQGGSSAVNVREASMVSKRHERQQVTGYDGQIGYSVSLVHEVLGGLMATRISRSHLGELEPLSRARPEILHALSIKFEDLLERVQSQAARKGMEAAFNASPMTLGRAAASAVRQRH